MGYDRIISAKESVYRLVSLELVGRSAPSKFQMKQVNLEDLHWTREEDGEFETAYPQFMLASNMLEGLDPKMLGSSLKLTDFATLVLLRYTLTSGLKVIMGVWLVSFGGTMGLEVILVRG
ncbi:hypothetical protein Tco_0307657 [Tanacetum coccineum]